MQKLIKKRIDAGLIGIVLFLLVVAVVMALPIVYLVVTAFKPLDELFVYPPTFFVRNPTTSNFSSLVLAVSSSMVPFSRYLVNSLFISGVVVTGVVLISSMAAYPLAKHRFPARNLIFKFVVASLMFAPEVIEIPRYIFISHLNIMNTYFVLILPQLCFPIGLFLMKQFMEQIPDAIFEAAKIDGANQVVLFRQIALPQVKPASATVIILAFIQVWNDIASSSLFVQNERIKTLPYFLSTISGQGVATVGTAAAAAFLLLIPTVTIFLLFQRQVISTMAYSGIKQ